MTTLRVALGATFAVTLAGQACTAAYEIVAARQFGTTRDADALGLTFALVFAVGSEFASWVVSLFIPHYVQADTRAGPASAQRFLRATFVALTVGGAAVAAVIMLAAGPMISLIAPDLTRDGATAHLLRLFAPLALLLPLGVLLAGRLQVGGQFIAASSRPVFWYGSAVVALLVLGRQIGPSAVAAGMVTGLTFFCVLLAVKIRALPVAGDAGEHGAGRLRSVGRQFAPLVVGSVANYVNVTIERSLAARLPEGSLAALTYAFRLLNVPVTLFVLNASTVIFPALALLAARENREGMSDLVGRALRVAIAFTVLLAGLSMALARPGVRLLLERGAFTPESTDLTATALIWYAPGLIGIGAGQILLTRVYYALHDVPRLIAIGVLTIIVNIILMIGLTPLFGLRALPAAASTSALFMLVLMLIGLQRTLPGLTLHQLTRSALPMGLAGVAAYAAAFLPQAVGADAPYVLIGGGLGGVATYIGVLVLVSRADARLIFNLMFPRQSTPHSRA